ncbi:MAG: thermonuclease family protein [Phycisphaerae bacterium]|nr:thermonuclease family protein [Phycisphaerae bacterium]
MNRKHWSKRIGIAALILGLAAIGTSLLPAQTPPPKPKPHPKAHKAARRHVRARKVARHKHNKRLRRIPRRRQVLVRRVGTAVVVEQGGTVVQKVPVATIQSAETLQAVPVRNVAEVATYKVVKVSDDCSSVVVIKDGKKTSVRLIGVAAIPGGSQTGTTGSKFVRNLLKGEFVSLEYDSTLAQEDETGQAVAYLYRAPDGMLLNLEVIRQGYGLAADYYPYQHDKLFRFYQQKAQADGKGVWASVKTTVPAEEKTPLQPTPGTLTDSGESRKPGL